MKKEVTNDRSWSEMSWIKYNPNSRKYWYEKDVFDDEYDYDNVLYYGLYEDLSLYDTRSIEDWWEIVEEYN